MGIHLNGQNNKFFVFNKKVGDKKAETNDNSAKKEETNTQQKENSKPNEESISWLSLDYNMLNKMNNLNINKFKEVKTDETSSSGSSEETANAVEADEMSSAGSAEETKNTVKTDETTSAGGAEEAENTVKYNETVSGPMIMPEKREPLADEEPVVTQGPVVDEEPVFDETVSGPMIMPEKREPLADEEPVVTQGPVVDEEPVFDETVGEPLIMPKKREPLADEEPVVNEEPVIDEEVGEPLITPEKKTILDDTELLVNPEDDDSTASDNPFEKVSIGNTVLGGIPEELKLKFKAVESDFAEGKISLEEAKSKLDALGVLHGWNVEETEDQVTVDYMVGNYAGRLEATKTMVVNKNDITENTVKADETSSSGGAEKTENTVKTGETTTSHTEQTPNGTVDVTTTKDENGNPVLVVSEYKTADGKVWQKNTVEYYSDGSIKSEIVEQLDNKGSISTKNIKNYNQNGVLINEEIFISVSATGVDGTTYSKLTNNNYDKNGNLTSSRSDSYNNTNGKLTKTEYITYSDNQVQNVQSIVYDKNGTKVELNESKYNNGVNDLAYTRNTKYDNNGNVIGGQFSDQFGNRLSSFTLVLRQISAGDFKTKEDVIAKLYGCGIKPQQFGDDVLYFTYKGIQYDINLKDIGKGDCVKFSALDNNGTLESKLKSMSVDEAVFFAQICSKGYNGIEDLNYNAVKQLLTFRFGITTYTYNFNSKQLTPNDI